MPSDQRSGEHSRGRHSRVLDHLLVGSLLGTLLLAASLLIGCGGGEAPSTTPEELLQLSWEQIEEQARGQRVTWGMWTGDPKINAYVSGWVSEQLKERYDIQLDVVSAQGNQIVNLLLTELEAGKGSSDLDMVWINGETFYQLRQIDALAGPFTDTLPSAAAIDFENPFIAYDFQQPVDGYEAPWGNVQLALIYDSKRVAQPPRNPEELAQWARENPGRFTFDTAFTGMTFLKSLLIHFAGGPGSLDGPFDEARYAQASDRLFAYLEEIQPFLWKEGETLPTEVAQLHQLFANGEVDFTMSNNDGEVDNKVLQGILPESSRAYVLESGTIQNSHYLGLVKGGQHSAGALVAINFLLSAEAQYEKMKPAVWGDGTVLDVQRLPEPWPQRFGEIPQRERSPKRDEIRAYALQEPAPETMIRLYEDVRRRLLES